MIPRPLQPPTTAASTPSRRTVFSAFDKQDQKVPSRPSTHTFAPICLLLSLPFPTPLETLRNLYCILAKSQ